MSNIIHNNTLTDICKMGQGEECCRYILCGLNGFECGKHGGLKNTIDQRVNSNLMTAKGDNCNGLK